MNSPAPGPSVDWPARGRRFAAAAVRAFHAYANWLVSISWKRFIVLAVMLLIVVGIVHDMPPFTWTVTETIEHRANRSKSPTPPKPPRPPKAVEQSAPRGPADEPIRVDTARSRDGQGGVEITIGKEGIRVRQRDAAPQAASGAASSGVNTDGSGIEINLPPGADSNAVRAAVEEARQQIQESIREAREAAEQATRDAEQARQEAERALAEAQRELEGERSSTRTTRVGIGDFLMQFTWLWIVASAIIKFSYKGRMQAEVKAAQATETAEAESLKRQVVEARMAAMQAQVEPHFLFNTLASIDHLIETDPARASTMQKNLIALLRASMPTMREASDGGVRELGRELEVIRPYLEILKVRMEERLSTAIDVSDGLLSAEFPPMMIQTLVENAIKHGLEPKAEGGLLRVAAEIVHGKLQVTVSDTGLGFGRAATAGTGVGLANIRERLQLLYGSKASLTVAENPAGGTIVTITVPYKSLAGAFA
jgi:hypothetical protein